MWYKFRVNLFFILFIFLSSVGFSQQKWPNTFLWRISGNGLTKPSYLYGTIHLEDKRLFQFSDSLYHSLESVEGFALEIDFKEFLDSFFMHVIAKEENKLLQEGVTIDREKLDPSADSILKKFGIKDVVTKRDLKKIRDYRINKLVGQGEMQTIVDGYLYGLALRQGKWIGGIEDVPDQLNILDELGGDLNPEKVFQPEASLKKSLNEMIRIYINRDLQSLADYSNGKDDRQYKDVLLIKRNVKMARRMDSLSKIRTMFFAVGVAHLPGDSGVITLLRERGFKVEPVFSAQTISPEAYAAKLSKIPWIKVDDDKTYSIDMPGTPSNFNMFGEVMKMKVFFDLPTMTFYMSGHSIGRFNTSNDIEKAFNDIVNKMSGLENKIKVKNISTGDIKGGDASFDIPQGSYELRLLQKKNTMYILMAGTSKKANLNTPDVNKFFSSFTAKDFTDDNKKWTKFTIPGKAFTVQVPGNPKPNNVIDRAAKGSGWTFSTYDFVDNEKGLYYLVQVRDINAGYYIEGDTTYFSLYKKDFLKRFDKLIKAEYFTYKGWPAFKIEGISKKENMLYKFFNVMRGNRIYVVIVGGQLNADFSDADEVFNSVSFENYFTPQYKMCYSEGFKTTAPASILKMQKDTAANADVNNRQHFISYDSNEVISFEIFKEPFLPYYWIKDDSSFFAAKVNAYKNFSDSVIKQEITYNGKLKALDLVIQKPENDVLKKIRLFVNGDTLYTILAFIPKQYINNKQFESFFDDFKVNTEIHPSIYTNKAKLLLEALKVKDSIEFTEALKTFNTVTFGKEDLPLLHKALIETYLKTEDNYSTVNERIVQELKNLADESTIQFVLEKYNRLNAAKEELKYLLLQVLANFKTHDSYSSLKKLLLSNLPSKGEANGLGYALRDSLKLTKTLYPDILSLSTDSAFTEAIIGVTNELLDSNLISLKEVLLYKKNFLSQAGKNLKLIKQGKKQWWSYADWISLIGKFNNKESNELIREFSKLNDIDIKYPAIIALIKNNQPVNAADIEKLAADKAYRKDLYEEFKKINKQKLFPAKYATQLKMAESEIYRIASEDEEPSSITFIGERVNEFMGKKQNFFLFKVSYGGDNSSEFHLGITGPYSLTDKQIITSSDASGLFWSQAFDKSRIGEQLREYLSSTEK